jgi:hypothetical protein
MTDMPHYLIEFDRLGRAGRQPAFEVAGSSAERIEVDLTGLIRKGRYLASREFYVSVDLDAGRVWVDHGRFGTGRISRIKIEPVS